MLEARGVTKRYGRVLANDGVDFRAAPGEVVALLGENGAGKSTLVKILSGCTAPDAGALLLEGRPAVLRSPRRAAALGIAAVHQHFALVPTLTVLENLRLSTGGAPASVAERARALLSELGLEVPLDARVADLPLPLQQRAELLRALLPGCRYLLLDEPTAALGPADAEAVRRLVRELAGGGTAVVLVTHKLADVTAAASRAVILRRGRAVADLPVAGADPASLAREMVGDLPSPAPLAPSRPGEELLALESVTCPGTRERVGLRDVTLALRRGEILGIAGVSGNGQETLADVAAGLARPASGRVRLAGRDASALGPALRSRLGLAHVPADRGRFGAAPALPVYRNLCLRRYGERRLSPGGWIDRRAWRAFAAGLAARAGASWDLDAPAGSLSGGNLQRLILARELDAGPLVLVAVYPTRGLDARSAAGIRTSLLDRRREGAVLLVSEDLEELLALSDRIAVLAEGRVAGVLASAEATPEALGRLMAGG